jgi:lipopolysaccharide transport system ATP-binding protein
MGNSNLSIQCSNIGKAYQLGERNDIFTLAEFFAKKLGRHKESKQPDQNTFWALRDVSFELMQGRVLGIVGRNGSGKSTLLKILSRITPPTTGEFGFNGSMSSLLEVGTGFKQELSGLDNIYLSGTSLGLKRKDIKNRLDEIIAFAEIEAFINTPVKRYSSGMYVRLAFAVAAHLEPDILLLDEVLAVGDQKFQRKCLQKMKSVAGEGRTVIFVSHNMQAVTQLCQEALLLDKGIVGAQGPVGDVVKAYIEKNREQMTQGGALTFPTPLKSNGAWISQIQLGPRSNLRLQYDIMESIPIHIHLVVQEEFQDLQLLMSVSSPEGMVLLNSREPDHHNSLHLGDDRILNIPTAPGQYELVGQIPAPFLNTGFYELHFHLIGHHSVVIDSQRGIQIEIHDHGASFSSCVNHKRSDGECVLPLSWSRARV